MEMGVRDNHTTTAAAVLLRALAEGREQEAWEDAPTLAKSVLEGGPFTMRKAEELAELVLGEGDVHRR
jgi:hypothetical protein